MTHLKENALLELEVLSHDVCDVGRLDREGDGNVGLLQDVVHLDNGEDGVEGEIWVTLKSQTTLPLVNLVTSTVTSSACSAMSPSLKSHWY